MARVPLDETPIFAQMTKEYVAKETLEKFLSEITDEDLNER